MPPKRTRQEEQQAREAWRLYTLQGQPVDPDDPLNMNLVDIRDLRNNRNIVVDDFADDPEEDNRHMLYIRNNQGQIIARMRQQQEDIDPDDWAFFDDDDGGLTAAQIAEINARIERERYLREVMARDERIDNTTKEDLREMLDDGDFEAIYEIVGRYSPDFQWNWWMPLKRLFDIDDETREWWEDLIVLDNAPDKEHGFGGARAGPRGQGWQYGIPLNDPRWDNGRWRDQRLEQELQQARQQERQQRQTRRREQRELNEKRRRRKHLVAGRMEWTGGANAAARERGKKAKKKGKKINYFEYFKNKRRR